MNRKNFHKVIEELKQHLHKKIEEAKTLSEFNTEDLEGVDAYINSIVSNLKHGKSFISATVTLLLVKFKFPEQDLNKHTAQLGGISFRTIDEKVTIPILRKHFPAYVNTSTAWLTPTFRGQEPLTEAISNKARVKEIKENFPLFIEKVNKNIILADKVLLYLLYRLFKMREQDQYELKTIINKNTTVSGPSLTIHKTVEILERFLNISNKKHLYTARLPVLMLYSIYKLLVSQGIGIYAGKHLAPLKHHNVSDMKEGYGDIEIYDEEGKIFEAVEVKHSIPINPTIVETKLNQVLSSPIKRYFFLTTAEPYIEKGYEDEIRKLIEQAKRSMDIEIVCNGVLHTIKYYLRIIGNTMKFMNLLLEILHDEYNKDASIIAVEHIKILKELLDEANTSMRMPI